MDMVRRLAWEGTRWFAPAALAAVIVLYAAAFCLDAVSCWDYLQKMAYEKSVLHFFYESDKTVSNVGLCLTALLGVGCYAQDYESGAAYMRIQRMGTGRYAGMRTAQTCISAFLAAGLGFLLFFFGFGLLSGFPLFPDTDAVSEIAVPQILKAGDRAGYLVFTALLIGMRAVLACLLTLAVSLAIPRRRMLAAMPLVIWYMMQYVMTAQEWIPDWLQPAYLFRYDIYIPPESLGLEGISEWGMEGILAGGLVLLAGAVWLLFCLRLKGNGIFGGEQVG